jgi:hypothetical protein
MPVRNICLRIRIMRLLKKMHSKPKITNPE